MLYLPRCRTFGSVAEFSVAAGRGRKILIGVGNIRSSADCRHVAAGWTSVGHFENESTTWKAAAKMAFIFRGFFPHCDQQIFSAHLLTVNLSQGSTA
jgi:hypothetical protein